MNEWEWHLLENKAPVASVPVDGVDVRAGARVRLRPRPGGDVLDLALAGQTATVEAIEQDYEGQIQLAVVLDEDPGRDLGLLRQPGHRFFFRPGEVEPLDTPSEPAAAAVEAPSILVAGIGNIFFGDDAFGVEVAQRLTRRALPPQVGIVDVEDHHDAGLGGDASVRHRRRSSARLFPPRCLLLICAARVRDSHRACQTGN